VLDLETNTMYYRIDVFSRSGYLPFHHMCPTNDISLVVLPIKHSHIFPLINSTHCIWWLTWKI